MNNKKYSIFGAGASGLYTALRLLNGKAAERQDSGRLPGKGDILELYDWGEYDFSKESGSRPPGSRVPGGRVCTWHYGDKEDSSYLELGGMRYSEWNGDSDAKSGGHRLVTKAIGELDLNRYSIPFNESTNPLFYLRTKNMYLNDITSANPAPYNVGSYGAASSPDNGFNTVEQIAVMAKVGPKTREDWCRFYQEGRITAELPESSVYKKGDLLKNIAYWNLMFDQLGSEGYSYTSDGNGYTSNVINWNAAVAMQSNNEFTPGTAYKTLSNGYSSLFSALFTAIVKLAKEKEIHFDLTIIPTGGCVRFLRKME